MLRALERVVALMSKAEGRDDWSGLMGRVAEKMSGTFRCGRYTFTFTVRDQTLRAFINGSPGDSWTVINGSGDGMVMILWNRDPTLERCDVVLSEASLQSYVERTLTFVYEMNAVQKWRNELQRNLSPECEVDRGDPGKYSAGVRYKVGSAETIEVMPCWTTGGYKTSVAVVKEPCNLFFTDAQHLKDHLMQCGSVQSSFDDLVLGGGTDI